MLRILHILGCADAGGISAVVRNYSQFVDKERVHFDIALTVPEQGQNSRCLEAMGAKIFFLPLKSQDPEGFRQGLERLLTEGRYDGVHVHENETSFVALKIAKQLGIPCRIAHSHESAPFVNIKGELKRLAGCVFNYRYATHVAACGRQSGERIFGKRNMKRPKAVIMPNAVDSQKFAFNPALREEVRKELGVENKLVLGMVCRLAEEKNVPFAYRLLAELKKTHREVCLVIAGSGPDEEDLKLLARQLSLGDSLKMLGKRFDVDRLYQAYDILLLPSTDEGFPVVPVEGMASGLPVLISTMVTDELGFGTGVRYLSLDRMDSWLRAVEEFSCDTGRESRQGEVKAHGLDIRLAAEKLMEIYEEDCGSGEK